MPPLLYVRRPWTKTVLDAAGTAPRRGYDHSVVVTPVTESHSVGRVAALFHRGLTGARIRRVLAVGVDCPAQRPWGRPCAAYATPVGDPLSILRRNELPFPRSEHCDAGALVGGTWSAEGARPPPLGWAGTNRGPGSFTSGTPLQVSTMQG